MTAADVSRRKFIRYAAGAAAGGLIALGLGDLYLAPVKHPTVTTTVPVTSSSSEFSSLPDYQDFLSWLNQAAKPYSGTTLKISLEEEFWPFTLQRLDQDFASASGISDQYSIKPYSLQLNDVSLMFSTRSSTYDLFGIDSQNLGVFPNDSISPLQMAEDYADITYPELNLSDFNRFIWDRVATYPPADLVSQNGNTPANTPVLPLDAPTQILFYRKDIFEKLGLRAPQTWDEHYANLQAVQKSHLTPYAGVSMAAPDISIVYEFLSHVASHGAELFLVDGETLTPNLTDDKVEAALTDFVELAPYSDPASSSYTWEDVFSSLAYGVSATGLLWGGYAAWLDDPGRSIVPGRFGYAPAPAGPAGSFSVFSGGGLGISKYCKNLEAAWLWMQWATARGTQEAALLDKFHVYPTRDSPLAAPELASELGAGSLQAAAVTIDIFKSKRLVALYGFPKWFNVLNSLANYLNQAWMRRATPSAALASAQNQISTLGMLRF